MTTDECEPGDAPVQWLKHAFAVEPRGPAEPTPEQQAVVEKLCHEVVRRQLTTPALMFLEMSRPLNFVGSQALHFFAPFIAAVTDAEGHRHLAAFLEHRGSIDYICRCIEALAESPPRQQGSQADQDLTAPRALGLSFGVDEGRGVDEGWREADGVSGIPSPPAPLPEGEGS
jgi:hypothetical protein